MKNTIEDRIRKVVASKIKVRITGRTRSPEGFCISIVCTAGNPIEVEHLEMAPTKAQALQRMLAIVRCMKTIKFSITPNQ